jgi:hypothetical protein
MGRTIPSFRIALDTEKADWKPFRNALDKSERKEFDDMFDIAQLYISACSNSVLLVPLHPIVMSILFHHYKELIQLRSEVEQVKEEAAAAAATTTVINNSSKTKEKKKERLMEKEEEEEEQEDSKTTKKKKSPTGKKEEPSKIDSYFINNPLDI